MIMRQSIALFLVLVFGAISGCQNISASSAPHRPRVVYPTVAQIDSADADILGDAALRLPGGPNYAYFRDALPPLRYVDANFRVYPITLSARAI